ncbi:killer cell lectin-like receptor subfamily F member 2 isoform X1 [Mustela erminea]|uniref:killer cell lectin-like receptor subfamily F member 2 isoform X1 n=1 Tax=Mustela erminea TaxID=36723 RepID=UPI0013873D75|nr:killer cell lectin-like receptor subfamily F member 2 isoform X1 [Mustela erminea]
MENEDGYMVLDYRNILKSRQRPKDFSLYPRYHCLMLVFGCIGFLIFMSTLICLNFWGTDKRMDFSQKVNISRLAGNNYLCPKDWLLNQEKCYKFSISSKTWNESQHDCANLQAHLPVIQTLNELKFIQKTLKPGNPGWIGLHSTSPGKQWMWINKHLFVEQNDFLMIGPTDHESCAVVTGKQVYSEDCNSKFNGICQRDAV